MIAIELFVGGTNVKKSDYDQAIYLLDQKLLELVVVGVKIDLVHALRTELTTSTKLVKVML